VLTQAEFDAARERAVEARVDAGSVLRDEERAGVEVAALGLSRLEQIGLEVIPTLGVRAAVAGRVGAPPRP